MSTPRKQVIIYTDGGCDPNPGPGGYGVVLLYGPHRKELANGYRRTTNNRMELMAAIAGLELLKTPCEVTLFSDSEYLVNAMRKGWASRWRANLGDVPTDSLPPTQISGKRCCSCANAIPSPLNGSKAMQEMSRTNGATSWQWQPA
ncbi:MAG: hypothetical protein NTV69_04565 [Caldilinea sp.]|nr:hypothetical protein [Caldilinea sp.]